jgi:hypothetical protein
MSPNAPLRHAPMHGLAEGEGVSAIINLAPSSHFDIVIIDSYN